MVDRFGVPVRPPALARIVVVRFRPPDLLEELGDRGLALILGRLLHLPGSVGLGQQRLVDLVPGAALAEPAVPLPHCLPRPERLRQITPGQAAAIPVDHILDPLPVVTHRPTSPGPLRRQQRLDQRPLLILKKRFTTHDPHTDRSLCSAFEDTP